MSGGRSDTLGVEVLRAMRDDRKAVCARMNALEHATPRYLELNPGRGEGGSGKGA